MTFPRTAPTLELLLLQESPIDSVFAGESRPIGSEASPTHSDPALRPQCEATHEITMEQCPSHATVKVFFELYARSANLCGPCMINATADLALTEWKIVERFR